MKITYKIDGQVVDRSVFAHIVADPLRFEIWEMVIMQHQDEIEKKLAAIVFKINDRKLHVLTETALLFKLSFLVEGQMKKLRERRPQTELV